MGYFDYTRQQIQPNTVLQNYRNFGNKPVQPPSEQSLDYYKTSPTGDPYPDFTQGAGSGYGGGGTGLGRTALGENFDRNASWTDIAGKVPQNLSRALLQNYNRIASEGAYAGAIPKIQQQTTAARNLRMAAIRDGLRRKLGRKLGPRSGAVDMALINSIYPQALADEQGTLADLLFKNEQSKLGGLDSAQQILQMLVGGNEADRALQAQKKANKFGWGDALGLIADVGTGLGSGGIVGGGTPKPKARV